MSIFDDAFNDGLGIVRDVLADEDAVVIREPGASDGTPYDATVGPIETVEEPAGFMDDKQESRQSRDVVIYHDTAIEVSDNAEATVGGETWSVDQIVVRQSKYTKIRLRRNPLTGMTRER